MTTINTMTTTITPLSWQPPSHHCHDNHHRTTVMTTTITPLSWQPSTHICHDNPSTHCHDNHHHTTVMTTIITLPWQPSSHHCHDNHHHTTVMTTIITLSWQPSSHYHDNHHHTSAMTTHQHTVMTTIITPLAWQPIMNTQQSLPWTKELIYLSYCTIHIWFTNYIQNPYHFHDNPSHFISHIHTMIYLFFDETGTVPMELNNNKLEMDLPSCPLHVGHNDSLGRQLEHTICPLWHCMMGGRA